MEQVLMREAVPLSASQWELVDNVVKETAKQILVGRRFLQLYGPLGFGVYTVPLYAYQVEGPEPVRARLARQLPLKVVHKDFIITVRDLDAFNRGQPFDIAPVAAAASSCAYAEDELIFNGDEEEGVEGLLNAQGRQSLTLNDWSKEGQALADVSAATAKLTAAGFYGPHAVIMHPVRHSMLHRVYGRRGIMEIDLVKKLASAGVFASPVMPEDKVLVISPKPQYVDLAVGQDMVTAYIETANMEHRFRVFETIALRIKQPGAICVLE